MPNVLLDTNFLIDYADETRPQTQEAATLFSRIIQGEIHACVAAPSLKDAYYLLCKHMGERAARDWVRVFVRAFEVEPLDVEVCIMALESDEPDYEDGCIRAIAERAGVDFIITRDRKAFARSYVKCYSAKEYLDLFG